MPNQILRQFFDRQQLHLLMSLPSKRNSKLFLFILTSLLVMSLPAAAQIHIATQPNPSPSQFDTNLNSQQKTLDGNVKEPKSNVPEKQPHNSQRKESSASRDGTDHSNSSSQFEKTRVNSQKKEDKQTSDAKSNGKQDSTKMNSAGQPVLWQRDLLPRLMQYAKAALTFLIILWLSALSWWTYKRNETLVAENQELNSEIMGLVTDVQRLSSELKGSSLSFEQALHISQEEFSQRISSHDQQLSTLQRNLSYQDDRFQAFQDRYDHQNRIVNADKETLAEPSQEHLPHPEHRDQVDSAGSIADEYQKAFSHGDRSTLRNMTSEQLNITQNSEDALMRSSSLPTQLEAVKNGGSYLLLHRDGKQWLVPEFQILTSFTTNQLAKGIFTYERNYVSVAELRRPAEVREVGGLWEVVSMGVIAVPV